MKFDYKGKEGRMSFIIIEVFQFFIGLCAVIASYFLHPGLGSLNSQIPLLLIALLIFYKHIPNIIRLVKGEEKAVA